MHFCLILDNRSSPREFPLGTHALLTRQGRFVKIPLLENPRPVLGPGRLGPVLAQINTDFFLFAHGRLAWHNYRRTTTQTLAFVSQLSPDKGVGSGTGTASRMSAATGITSSVAILVNATQ